LISTENRTEKGLEINKGPDWTPAQWIAGAAGFFASAAVAHFLAVQGYVSRNWAVAMVVAGVGVPTAVIGWLGARKR
jgi:hypothetical protein